MHSRNVVLAVAALLAGNALAARKSAVGSGHSLFRRQDDESQAFVPGNETRTGDTCGEAWGAGYIDCGPESNNLCYNPDDGQTCCENGGCTSSASRLVTRLRPLTFHSATRELPRPILLSRRGALLPGRTCFFALFCTHLHSPLQTLIVPIRVLIPPAAPPRTA